jgi:UDP-N-acetylmuramoylalanine--D-glutamate ligase
LDADIKKYKKVSVIGAARSGVAAAKLLKKKGYKVFLSDSTKEEKVNTGFVNEIKSSGIDYEIGAHSEKVYDADLVVVSPGVPR